MPNLGGIDLVPMAAFFFGEEEIYAGASRPTLTLGNPCLSEMPTFRMRCEIKMANNVFS
jgi:hypothetical protein